MAAKSDAWKRDKVVVTICPYCSSEDITLDPDVVAVRLYHIL